MAPRIHIGDVGTVFEATIKNQDNVVVDISAASTKTFYFQKPSGAVIVKAGSLVNTGTDGKMKYVTASSSDLDEAGEWTVQGRVSIGSGDWHTDLVTFLVESNLS